MKLSGVIHIIALLVASSSAKLPFNVPLDSSTDSSAVSPEIAILDGVLKSLDIFPKSADEIDSSKDIENIIPESVFDFENEVALQIKNSSLHKRQVRQNRPLPVAKPDFLPTPVTYVPDFQAFPTYIPRVPDRPPVRYPPAIENRPSLPLIPRPKPPIQPAPRRPVIQSPSYTPVQPSRPGQKCPPDIPSGPDMIENIRILSSQAKACKPNNCRKKCKGNSKCMIDFDTLVMRLSLIEQKLTVLSSLESKFKISSAILLAIQTKIRQLDVEGHKGSPGRKGHRGLKGPTGIPGPNGECGMRSTISPPSGPPGPPGNKGDPGLQGDKVCGCNGAKGDSGPPGDNMRGLPGNPGPKGPKGRRGFTTQQKQAKTQQ